VCLEPRVVGAILVLFRVLLISTVPLLCIQSNPSPNISALPPKWGCVIFPIRLCCWRCFPLFSVGGSLMNFFYLDFHSSVLVAITPTFDFSLSLIPFIWSRDPPHSRVGLVYRDQHGFYFLSVFTQFTFSVTRYLFLIMAGDPFAFSSNRFPPLVTHSSCPFCHFLHIPLRFVASFVSFRIFFLFHFDRFCCYHMKETCPFCPGFHPDFFRSHLLWFSEVVVWLS